MTAWDYTDARKVADAYAAAEQIAKGLRRLAPDVFIEAADEDTPPTIVLSIASRLVYLAVSVERVPTSWG
jgi:hypothetical protein